eukprot:5462487-Alexandrium_andersonii.AAC.1
MDKILQLPSQDPHRRKIYMQYVRARESAQKGPPPELLQKIAASGNTSKELYFGLWLKCDKDWGKVVLYERSAEIKRSLERGKSAWLTEGPVSYTHLTLPTIC